LPDIKVLYTEGDGTRYADAMKQRQSGVVATAINEVGARHAREWQPETGEGWPTYYLPVPAGEGVPTVTIEVAMDPFRQDTYDSRIDFFHYLAELDAALTAATINWLDGRGDEFRGVGFTFAVAWRLRPASGSLTAYDTGRTTGRYVSQYK